jgi:hypothetical protein
MTTVLLSFALYRSRAELDHWQLLLRSDLASSRLATIRCGLSFMDTVQFPPSLTLAASTFGLEQSRFSDIYVLSPKFSDLQLCCGVTRCGMQGECFVKQFRVRVQHADPSVSYSAFKGPVPTPVIVMPPNSIPTNVSFPYPPQFGSHDKGPREICVSRRTALRFCILPTVNVQRLCLRAHLAAARWSGWSSNKVNPMHHPYQGTLNS